MRIVLAPAPKRKAAQAAAPTKTPDRLFWLRAQLSVSHFSFKRFGANTEE